MTLLVDGASRALRGKRIYTNLPNILSPYSKVSKPLKSKKAGVAENGQDISLKKQTIRSSLPRGQGKE